MTTVSIMDYKVYWHCWTAINKIMLTQSTANTDWLRRKHCRSTASIRLPV